VPSHAQLLQVYRTLCKQWAIETNSFIEKLLQKRWIRSESGIVAVQVLTKPFWCPGTCIFCPNDPTMPKSYIKTEPWAMRAYLNQFDPIKQVYNRMRSLRATGHKTDKIELIVLWWTRDVYPDQYKKEFIAKLYYACNTFETYREHLEQQNRHGKSIKDFKQEFKDFDKEPEKFRNKVDKEWMFDTALGQQLLHGCGDFRKEIKTNETASNRVIGLTVETRPEYITDTNCRMWREMWVTRLEIGIQSTDDEVLEANKRDNTVSQYRVWLHRLRQYGFKFSIHIMPWLYTSTYQKDLKTFVDIYTDPHFFPDEIKFYPTSVIPQTELYDLYKQWKYTPISTQYIQDLVRETFFEIIPPYTRIKRLIRDIPSTEIAAGSNITNLAQLTHQTLQKAIDLDQDLRSHLYKRLYISPQNGKTTDFCTTIIQPSSIENFLHNPEKYLQSDINESKKHIQDMMENSAVVWVDAQRYFVSLDTRSREIRHRHQKSNLYVLVIRSYDSSVWQDYFISFEDELGYVYWFLRLCLPKKDQAIDREWLGKNTWLVRELHVYGTVAWLKTKAITWESTSRVQHAWFWKQLLLVAESIAAYNTYTRLSVISWVWVRQYYAKQWFALEWTYMIKTLN